MSKNPIINAIKFLGFQNEETKAIGLEPLPLNFKFQCRCGYGSQNHLMFNKHLICPNNYIVFEGREVTGVMDIAQFESIYKSLTYQDIKFKEVVEELKETKENA